MDIQEASRKKLLEKVKKNYEAEQVDTKNETEKEKEIENLCQEIENSIQSIGRLNTYARYHWVEIEKILLPSQKNLTKDPLSNSMINLFEQVTTNRKRRSEYSRNPEKAPFFYQREMAEAHAIACIHNLHATHDTVAYVVCKCLNLQKGNNNMKKDRDINLYKVIESLQQGKKEDEMHWGPEQKIHHHLSRLRFSDEFEYINDLNNKAKHQSIVDIENSISYEQGRSGLKLSAFSVKKLEEKSKEKKKSEADEKIKTYEPRWLEDVVYAVSELQADVIGKIWNGLEEWGEHQEKNCIENTGCQSHEKQQTTPHRDQCQAAGARCTHPGTAAGVP